MKSLFSVLRNSTLVLPAILFLVAISCYSPDKGESENHPMIILKDERVMEIRNLAKQDELLQEIIEEIFRMANAELDQPFINYEDLIGRPHRTTREALSGKYVLDIASLSGFTFVSRQHNFNLLAITQIGKW